MHVFDWEPGSTTENFDKADQMEQLWIGFLYYELGNRVFSESVNCRIPEPRGMGAARRRCGMTKEQMRTTFAKFQESGDVGSGAHGG